ncbi:MAG: WXG100 family type VII secretion target [Oscillospiraceae bacterium]|nr:WXG100 family type VII secretion target [Oscillospiraceae bacterium]MCR5166562.1 WXG100 family type VII secretion target [Oscillospiraceae bacterium]
MASEQIKVDTQQLKNYSNEIKNSYQKMYNYLSQSKTAVKNLRSTWSGQGATEFYTRFDSIIAKCEEVLKVVNDYSVTLSQSADVYDSNEKKVTDSANKLKIQLK